MFWCSTQANDLESTCKENRIRLLLELGRAVMQDLGALVQELFDLRAVSVHLSQVKRTEILVVAVVSQTLIYIENYKVLLLRVVACRCEAVAVPIEFVYLP